jgi:plastocyanin
VCGYDFDSKNPVKGLKVASKTRNAAPSTTIGMISLQLKQCFAGVLIAGGAIVAISCNSKSEAKREHGSLPIAREIVISTVPLLTKELAQTYPFLKADFAKGGVLDGKELYSFEPSSITVFEGDTLHLAFVNPEDDPHSFVMKGLAVSIPGQAVTHATYVASAAGIFDFVCAIPAHAPMMRGELVVLRRPTMSQ